jgi:hypothetical protein
MTAVNTSALGVRLSTRTFSLLGDYSVRSKSLSAECAELTCCSSCRCFLSRLFALAQGHIVSFQEH